MSDKRRPRVLHVGKYLPPVPGGIETYLGDLLRVSLRHGLEVGAVVHAKKGHPDPNPDNFGGAQIYIVPSYGQVLYAPVAPMFPWVLRRAIKEFKPDILHMHVPNISAFWALFIPEAREIHWLLHWHADVDFSEGSFFKRAVYQCYRIFENHILKISKVIVTTSHQYLASSLALKPHISKCRVIPLTIDLSRLASPTEVDLDVNVKLWRRSEEPRFLAVGRLTFYKGYDRLIRVVARSSRGSLVIVGDGDLMPQLQALVEQLGAVNRVTLVGALSERNLAACYSLADVLCMTSTNRSEAFGLVILEAACYGVSPIAAEIPGSPSAMVAKSLGGDSFPLESDDRLGELLLTTARRKDNVEFFRRIVMMDVSAFFRCYQEMIS